MVNSILFVGAEQALWQEFRTMVASASFSSSLLFAHSAAEALALMEANSVEGVVSDVQLVDSNGPDFLDQILRRWPSCLRILISDFADTGSTLQCIGRGHHHLSRPCDASTLLKAFEHASRVGSWSASSAAQQILADMKNLPSPPSLYFQVVEEIASPNASIETVGNIISQDPAIAAKLLQLANSAVFGLQLQVNQPAEAVAFIGLETTGSLVLLAHSFASFEALGLEEFSVQSLWDHSVVTGRNAREIATLEGARSELVDQTFTAGLLHDLGKLLLAANLREKFVQALRLSREEQLSFSEAEMRVYGTCHSEVGGLLLGIWGLPKLIVEAVGCHHSPSRLSPCEFHPGTAIHVANVLCHEASGCAIEASAPLDEDYLRGLGLEERVSAWRSSCGLQGEPVSA